jgi:hypothetical protein
MLPARPPIELDDCKVRLPDSEGVLPLDPGDGHGCGITPGLPSPEDGVLSLLVLPCQVDAGHVAGSAWIGEGFPLVLSGQLGQLRL